jgi:hypothetical protein
MRLTPRSRLIRKIEILSAFLLMLWVPADGFGQEAGKTPAAAEPFRLVCGYSARTFADVGLEDAKIVTKLWTETIAGKRNGVADTVIYEDIGNIEKDVKAKKVDVLALLPDDFLALKSRLSLEAAMVTATEAGPFVKVLLLARKDKGLRRVQDLKNKNLVPANGQFSSLYQIWCETILMREGLNAPIKAPRKPNQAVLAVFFQQADACIVNQATFQVMTELNPQIGRELGIVAESPDLGGGVIAFRKDYSETHKETVREALTTLHADPKGRQLLTLFQLQRLVPYQPGYFDTMETLIKEHRSLKMKKERLNS